MPIHPDFPTAAALRGDDREPMAEPRGLVQQLDAADKIVAVLAETIGDLESTLQHVLEPQGPEANMANLGKPEHLPQSPAMEQAAGISRRLERLVLKVNDLRARVQ